MTSERLEAAAEPEAAEAGFLRAFDRLAVPTAWDCDAARPGAQGGGWQIGPFVLVVPHAAGHRVFHTGAVLPGRGSAGHWVVCIPLDGVASLSGGDLRYEPEPIAVALGRLDEPGAEMCCAPGRVTVLVPDGASPPLDAALRAHLTGRITGPRASLLQSFLTSVAAFMADASDEDLPRLADAMRAMLFAAFAPAFACRSAAVTAGDPKAVLRARVEAVIAENIGSARLDAARIARLAGISRTTLYRIFDGSGGVAAHVRMVRLGRVYSALRDPAQSAEPIAAIAERHGFHCVASFNRAFRRAYGVTPGGARA